MGEGEGLKVYRRDGRVREKIRRQPKRGGRKGKGECGKRGGERGRGRDGWWVY